MRPAILLRAVALAALTAATLAAAPPLRPADAHALAQPPAPATRPYVRPADRWFGETRAVAVEGDRAYYSVGRAVAVADIGDPAGPRLIGRSAPLATGRDDVAPTPITDMAVSGRWLWAITGSGKDGVALFDVQDPNRPVLRAIVPMAPERSIEAIVARERHAVLVYAEFDADRGRVAASGLLAVRVDPSGAPHVAGQWIPDEPLNQPHDLVWTGDTLVVSGGYFVGRMSVTLTGEDGIRLEPAGFASYDGLPMNQLAADGCRVYGSYRADRSAGVGQVRIFDVCADVPRQLGMSDQPSGTFAGPRDMVRGISAATWGGRNLVFMTDAAGGMWTIDATDPTSMTWSADSLIEPVTTTPACLGDTAVAGPRLVASGCGLAVLEMKGGAALPQWVGRLPHPPLSWEGGDVLSPRGPAIWAEGDDILIARMNVLSTIDWVADAPPAVVGQIAVHPNGDQWSYAVLDIAVADDTAWMADVQSGGLFGFDVRDRRRPVRVAQLQLTGWQEFIAADGDVLATVEGDGPIRLFDVADAAAPRPVGTIDRPGPVLYEGEMLLADGRLYVASRAGLEIYDVGDPSAPMAGPFDHAVPLWDAALNEDWIVTLAHDQIRVYDRAAAKAGTLAPVALIPLPPSEPSPFEFPRFIDVNLGRVGDHPIVIASGERSLLAIDIADPAIPIIGTPYLYTDPAFSITVAGDRIFLVSEPHAGIARLDLGLLLVGSVLRLPFLANLGG
ncbi:MAG: hypothetical protein IT332_12925 [Ardenticatenales bacterium]|nr:hypothetical protein [Ardenticatenales bacterium]